MVFSETWITSYWCFSINDYDLTFTKEINKLSQEEIKEPPLNLLYYFLVFVNGIPSEFYRLFRRSSTEALQY